MVDPHGLLQQLEHSIWVLQKVNLVFDGRSNELDRKAGTLQRTDYVFKQPKSESTQFFDGLAVILTVVVRADVGCFGDLSIDAIADIWFREVKNELLLLQTWQIHQQYYSHFIHTNLLQVLHTQRRELWP